MKCRRSGTRHRRWRRRSGYGGWWCRPGGRRCGRPRWSTSSVSLAGSLGGRADARRQHRDANQKHRQANATRKHDRAPSSKSPAIFNAWLAQWFVVGGGRHCDVPTQAVSREILLLGDRDLLQQLVGQADRRGAAHLRRSRALVSRVCDLLQRVEARLLLAAQRGIAGSTSLAAVSVSPLN